MVLMQSVYVYFLYVVEGALFDFLSRQFKGTVYHNNKLLGIIFLIHKQRSEFYVFMDNFL